jgi:hypothetical protein
VYGTGDVLNEGLYKTRKCWALGGLLDEFFFFSFFFLGGGEMKDFRQHLHKKLVPKKNHV